MSSMNIRIGTIIVFVLLVSLQCTVKKGESTVKKRGTGSVLTPEEKNKAIAKLWIDEVWNKGNSSAINKLFAANFVAHYPGFPTTDRESYKQWMAMEFATFADVVCTPEDIIAEGDKVVIRWTWRGKHSMG